MDLRIERLTPARGDDYLRFFDHEHGPAFADNPEWATCYCHYYEVPTALTWSDFDGPMNRRRDGGAHRDRRDGRLPRVRRRATSSAG